MIIDRTKGAKPLYIQVKEDIKKKIEARVYIVNKPIPSEDELINLYSVSRSTIREAILQLVQDGIIHKKRGIGTFVSEPKIGGDLITKQGFKEEMSNKGIIINTTFSSICSIDESNFNFSVKRVRSQFDVPLVYSESKLFLDFNLLEYKEAVNESLYTFLNSKSIVISKIIDEIELTFLNKKTAHHLNMKVNEPALLKTRNCYNQYGSLIEESKSYYNPTLYKYEITHN